MSSQYFMRNRGRVLGPYELDKLQQLARRGQLSKMHEVSTDGASWTRASSFPELFVGSQEVEAVVEATQSKTVQETVQVTETVTTSQHASQQGPVSQTQWHYTSGGMQRGPIDFSQLQLLAASGQLHPTDQVWTDGMPAWVNAANVPGLTQTGRRSTIPDSEDADSALPKSLCKAAISSKGWATLIAAVVDIASVLMFILGFLLVIVGARERLPNTVGSGILNMLHAIVWFVAGLLLHTYCRRLGTLEQNGNAVVLEKTMDALRTFWTYAAIYLIVMLVFITIGAVYMFDAGVTFPNLR